MLLRSEVTQRKTGGFSLRAEREQMPRKPHRNRGRVFGLLTAVDEGVNARVDVSTMRMVPVKENTPARFRPAPALSRDGSL